MAEHTVKTQCHTAHIKAKKTTAGFDMWSDHELAVFMAYAPMCLKLHGEKWQFSSSKMHAFWTTQCQEQSNVTPKEMVLNNRSPESFSTKWAGCVRYAKFKLVIAAVMTNAAKETEKRLEVDAVKALISSNQAPAAKRTRSRTPPPPPTSTVIPTEPQTVLRESGRTLFPTENEIREWMRSFLEGKTKSIIENTPLKAFREGAETHFRLHFGELAEKRHLFERLPSSSLQ